MNLDLSLYLVTDRPLSRGRDIRWIVSQAVQGGATVVQLREKDLETRAFIKLAIDIKALLDPKGIPLIINDRLDVVLAAEADGLHVGQSDMPYGMARRLLGPDKIIGLSVESVGQARQAQSLDADYLGISPVFGTATKTDLAQPMDLAGVAEIAAFTRIPTVGIGGIGPDNAAKVMAAGADGVAVVSAIVSADDPCQAARNIMEQVKAGRRKRRSP